MLNRDFASGTSNIGMRAVAPAAIPANQPNLGLMLAEGMKAYNEKKEYDKEQEKLSAYATALKEQHPEDAARIDAMGALNAGAWYDALAKDEKEQQFKLDLLDQQNRNAIGLENLRNRNAYGLATFKNNLANSIADAERERKLAAIDQMEQSGQWTHEQAEMNRAKINLGDLVDAGDQSEMASKEKARENAQKGVNVLGEVARDNLIGPYTDWRRKKGLVSKRTMQEYGRISSAISGIAPIAIANLKAAGVSGINTKGEFYNYIGLPENPTSSEIAGALPLICEIAGVENPLENMEQQSGGLFNKKPGDLFDVGATQKAGNFTITRVK